MPPGQDANAARDDELKNKISDLDALLKEGVLDKKKYADAKARLEATYMDPADKDAKVKNLEDMKNAGVIDEEEYDSAMAKLMGTPDPVAGGGGANSTGGADGGGDDEAAEGGNPLIKYGLSGVAVLMIGLSVYLICFGGGKGGVPTPAKIGAVALAVLLAGAAAFMWFTSQSLLKFGVAAAAAAQLGSAIALFCGLSAARFGVVFATFLLVLVVGFGWLGWFGGL